MNTWLEQLASRSSTTVEDAASDPALVRAAVAEIGSSACQWAIESAREIIGEVQTEFAPGTAGVLTGHELEAFEAGLLTTLIALHNGTPAEEVVRPRGAEENVRVSARQGVPVGTLLRTVWSCHTRTQDALLRELYAFVAPPEFMPQLLALNAALYSYVDLYVKALTTEYQDELLAWSGHIPAERLHIMTSLLAGEDPPPTAERALGIRLTDHHLVGIAWQSSTRHVPDRQAELSRLGARIGRTLGASTSLTLHHDGVADFWWSFTTHPVLDPVRSLRSVGIPEWARLAIGEPGSGLDGFRASYAAATQAARVGRRSDRDPVSWYRDVRVIALLAADEQAARRFVRDELRGITTRDAKTTDLRETLRLFLRSGNSRLLAARELNLAANTVAYRVARASELMGRTAAERPTETLLALELAARFPDFLDSSELEVVPFLR